MRNLVTAAAGRLRAAAWALVLTLAALSFAVTPAEAASTNTGGPMIEQEPVGRTAVAVDDMTVEAIAIVAHEANRAYCEVIGDASQRPWNEAEQWQRDSARAGVRAALDGTATTPEQQHETWAEDKRAQGWTHGPVKDSVAKTHPCLVPYAELPVEQQRKDHLFRAVVQAFTAQEPAVSPVDLVAAAIDTLRESGYVILSAEEFDARMAENAAMERELASALTQPWEHIAQFFAYEHLQPHLGAVSRPFGQLAARVLTTLPRNPERTVALRKLLEAKDAAVRALLAKPVAVGG